MKEIISLYNNGRLANQLWSAASLYAYCLEKGYKYSNYAFFPYQNYYDKTTGRWFIDKVLSHAPRRVDKAGFLLYAYLTRWFNYKWIVDDRQTEFLLPPTETTDKYAADKLKDVDAAVAGKFYFWGWVFRNPVGLKKYFFEIKSFFRPAPRYLAQINSCLDSCRHKGKIIIGVHVRHGDFKEWNGGVYYFSFEEVRLIIDNFLSSRANSRDYLFLICSDSKVDEEVFSGINYIVGPGNVVSDLYCLAGCDAIFGPGGTYGPWAAYYGGIPFIRFSREKTLWPVNL